MQDLRHQQKVPKPEVALTSEPPPHPRTFHIETAPDPGAGYP